MITIGGKIIVVDYFRLQWLPEIGIRQPQVLSSFMAREGITNIVEAINRYYSQAKRYHLNYKEGDLETYLNAKAKEKSKRYNIPRQGLHDD